MRRRNYSDVRLSNALTAAFDGDSSFNEGLNSDWYLVADVGDFLLLDMWLLSCNLVYTMVCAFLALVDVSDSRASYRSLVGLFWEKRFGANFTGYWFWERICKG